MLEQLKLSLLMFQAARLPPKTYHTKSYSKSDFIALVKELTLFGHTFFMIGELNQEEYREVIKTTALIESIRASVEAKAAKNQGRLLL